MLQTSSTVRVRVRGLANESRFGDHVAWIIREYLALAGELERRPQDAVQLLPHHLSRTLASTRLDVREQRRVRNVLRERGQ
jgi:hypothetical protein